MSLIFAILAGVAALGVVVVLLAGLTTMVRPNMVDPQTKTKLMQYRVRLQAVAVLLFLIAVLLASAG